MKKVHLVLLMVGVMFAKPIFANTDAITPACKDGGCTIRLICNSLCRVVIYGPKGVVWVSDLLEPAK